MGNEIPELVLPNQAKLVPLPSPRLSMLVRDVSVACCTEIADILGRSHHKSHAAARHIAMWIARTRWLPQPSFPELGREFHRDHSTIMSAVDRIEEEIAKNTELGCLALRIAGSLTTVRLIAGEGAVYE